MDVAFPFLVLGGVAVVAWVIARALEDPGKARDELLNTLATQGELVVVGGARIGRWNFSTPFAKMRVSHGGIEITAPFISRKADWTDLSSAHLIQPVVPIGQGLQIASKNSEPVIFWANRGICWGLLDVMERHDVPVSRSTKLLL
jgi:prolipoprotein diacylglyceryltransferase